MKNKHCRLYIHTLGVKLNLPVTVTSDLLCEDLVMTAKLFEYHPQEPLLSGHGMAPYGIDKQGGRTVARVHRCSFHSKTV